MTQQLARAERDWQAPLVRRGPRGASLTAAGALLARYGGAIAAETESAAAGLAALLGELRLRLRLGGFQAAALHLLPPALTALRHRHPDADVSVVDVESGCGEGEITAGRLDLAVVASWARLVPPPPRVARHLLLRDPMVVVVLPDDHPLARACPAGTPLELARLHAESWVTILAGHAAREQFDRAAARAGFTPRVRFQTQSYDVAQALVGTGMGVALVSRLALAGAPGATHRELATPQPYRLIQALTAADTALTPLVEVFLGLLRDVARDIAAGWQAARPPAR